MTALSNDDREAERLALLNEATAERHPTVPWWETHRRPSPPPPVQRPLIRTVESRRVTERRRRILLDSIPATGERWENAA